MQNNNDQVKLSEHASSDHTFYLLVLVAAIFSLIFVAYMLRGHNIFFGSRSANIPKQTSLDQKIVVPENTVPEGIPADIPMPTNAVVIDNFTKNNSDGSRNSQRSFETSLSIEESIRIYSNYMRSNGWGMVKQPISQSGISIIAGAKDNQNLTIMISENKTNSTKVVVIDLFEKTVR